MSAVVPNVLVEEALRARRAADWGTADARHYWLGYRDAVMRVSGMSGPELGAWLDDVERHT